jgi:hypothetical protein
MIEKIIFSLIPALLICEIVMRPLLKTMALGGVATGSIKAQLAAMVVGTTNVSTSTPIPTAMDATIGIKAAVVAELLVNSVRKMTSEVNKNIISHSLIW